MMSITLPKIPNTPAKIKNILRKLILSVAQKKLGLNIVTKEKLVINTGKYNVMSFGSEEVVSIDEPYGLEKIPTNIAKKIGLFTIHKPFVVEVSNAELVGSRAVGFDQDKNVILETTVPQLHGLEKSVPIRTLILNNQSKYSVSQLDTACSLVNVWSRNYFHWLIDCLPRIEGLEHYQQQTGFKPVVIIESNPTSWQIESLKLLGYNVDDCIQWNLPRIQVKRLVVPSFRRDTQDIVSTMACRWIHQRVLSNLSKIESEKLTFSPRIFISRPKSALRRVVNEDDVVEALTRFGFVAYRLEEMKFSDQVRLFSQAEIIVAPHGAGLTNMIFSQKTIVIELLNSWINPCFFTLSKQLGFQYGFLKCKSSRTEFRQRRANMIVDIADLQNLIAKLHE